MIRFLHTADLQLGKPFHGFEGDTGAHLRELRFAAIDRLAEAAREREVNFVVVAGDLFDANTVEDRVVGQACERLGRIEVPVLVIPGNHDHSAAPDCVYRRKRFVDDKPANVVVLEEPEPYTLPDLATVILPAPLRRRHEVGDTTAHITSDLGASEEKPLFRVGLAHGSVASFGDAEQGESEATNYVDPGRAESAHLDYLALGDWHSKREVTARTWYSGTPEPTGFAESDPGHALLVTLSEPGAEPGVEAVPVGTARWLEHEVELTGPDDVERLESWLEGIDRPEETLLRLALTGSLSLAERDHLEDMLESAEARLRYLERAGAGVVAAPTEEEIDELATGGYVKTAVDRLRERASGGGDEARAAADALELLHQLKVQDQEAARADTKRGSA